MNNETGTTQTTADAFSAVKVEENKRENKKALTGFTIIMVISVIVGGILGASSNAVEQYMKVNGATGQSMEDFIVHILGTISPFAILAIGIVGFSIAYAMIRKTRREFAQWDMEEEETYDRMEKRLSDAVGISSSIMILDFFLFAVGFYYFIYDTKDAFFAVAILSYLVSIGIIIFLQQKTIDLEKEINLEKKGSIYDMNFQSKWLESCDEAEQLLIYKAAYKTYQAVNFLCIFIWVILVLSAMVFQIGILPVSIVTLIWFVMQTVYLAETAKLTKKKHSK